MDALLVGPQQQLPVTPTRCGHCVAVQFDEKFDVFEQNRPPVIYLTTILLTSFLQLNSEMFAKIPQKGKFCCSRMPH